MSSIEKTLRQYLREVEYALASGQATEHTYRPALKTLLESCGKEITAINEPKRVECGAPDFFMERDREVIGFIEAKDVGKDLAEVEKTEQMVRYLEALPNLILTDYLNFRWYQNGTLTLSARLAEVGPEGKLRREGQGESEFSLIMEGFLSSSLPAISSPKDLAGHMAGAARLIRDVIQRAFATEESASGPVHAQLEGFRKVLWHDLEIGPFSDMYAQTICYGLFAARYHHRPERGPFTREAAVFELPETNPFLREMFNHLAGPNLDDRLAWAVNHLASVLNRADLGAVLQNFGRRTRQEDPVFHFYETFLAAYDPGLREKRGVYYTPEPVVSYIVRSVDHVLREDFGLADGLATSEKVPLYKNSAGAEGKFRREKTGESHRVLILDPAAGTGAFLRGVIAHIHQHLAGKRQSGTWDGYVSRHLLPRLFGFELLMAPYTVAHLKLGLQLAETGYKFQSGERLRVYLTNTLEEAFALNHLPLFAALIAQEASEAGKVKTEAPVMVVLGNPPYSGHSANTGPWINSLLRGRDPTTGAPSANYFAVDGQPLHERNPKWLNDDYVKFIRFAQWRIERTGYGVLAFITNHGYLDNPTFRGMRQSLMLTFDDIYVLDLHGNAKKKEKGPDGSKDENVFDIQQGVAIGIFVKKPGHGRKIGAVRHAELWGIREAYQKRKDGEKELVGGKYRWLYDHDINCHKWTKLNPRPPFYLFTPQDGKKQTEYEKGRKLTEIMPVNVLGFQTHRDHFAIDFDREPLAERIRHMRSTALEDHEYRKKYQVPDNRDWKLAQSRARLRKLEDWQRPLQECLYRPFDIRHCYFDEIAMDYPRRELINHVSTKHNLCLLSSRQQARPGYRHGWISKIPAESCVVSTTSREGNQVFPLYLYPDPGSNGELFSNGREWHVNLNEPWLENISANLKLKFTGEASGDLKKSFGPEDVLAYIYAVLHSPEYRRRYSAFLKTDFPRIPLTSRLKLFRALIKHGRRLIVLHLLEAELRLITGYPVKGDNQVEKVRYDERNQRVYINAVQYFSGVPAKVWEFQVGGYQVCAKWLKDRKGRGLSYDDLTHYQRIVAALAETILVMEKIDREIKAEGGWPLS